MIVRVLVHVEGESEQVQLDIEWVGGTCTQEHIIRPVAKLTQLSNYAQLCERICALVSAGMSPEEIAQCLNQEGFHPPKRRTTFSREGVQDLMRRLGLGSQRSSANGRETLAANEWWLPELARVVGMPDITLYNWVRRGWVKARASGTASSPLDYLGRCYGS